MLRIGLIGQKGFPARWGGVEVHVDELARRLARRGHHVVVFNRRWYAAGGGGPRLIDGVTVVDVPTLRSRSLDAITHSVLSTLWALRRDLDIFHYHCMGPTLSAPLPRLAGKAVVATIHGFDYRAAKWGFTARTALRAGELMALRVPHRTVVVAEHLRVHYAALGYETIAIPNGVVPARHVGADEIARRWNLIRDGYLLFIARLEPDKRADALLDAFSSWRRSHPESNLRLVVAGPLTVGDQYIASLLARAGETVLLVGEAAGRLKAELISNARAVVFPSRFEGLPISLLEAMSASRTVLVSDIPAHREVVPRNAGLFCDAGTPGGMNEGLERLLALSPQEREALGTAASRVADTYRWDDATVALERVYREAVHRAAPRTRQRARSVEP